MPHPATECHPVDLAQPDRVDARGRALGATAGRLTPAPPTGGRVAALREVVGMARPAILLICPPGEGALICFGQRA